MRRWSFAIPVALGLCALCTIALSAQESSSAPAAHGLTSLLAARQLEAVATRDPDEPDRFIAALFHSGSQLLVVSARSTSPARVEGKLAEHRYREIYRDLHGAFVEGSKILFHDLGADGLHRDGDHAVDLVYERGGMQMFDPRTHKKRRKAQADDAFADADARYHRLLSLLISELRSSDQADASKP